MTQQLENFPVWEKMKNKKKMLDLRVTESWEEDTWRILYYFAKKAVKFRGDWTEIHREREREKEKRWDDHENNDHKNDNDDRNRVQPWIYLRQRKNVFCFFLSLSLFPFCFYDECNDNEH